MKRMKKTRGSLTFRFIKRTFDFLLSFFGLILSSPFMLLAVILVKLGSPGPILFKQKRMGLHETTFVIYKFRTMKVTANPHLSAMEMKNHYETEAPRFSRFLRKTRIDELPQLWNILKGDMSFIGPRPDLSPEFEPDIYNERKKYTPSPYEVRPGLSGLAQVKMRCQHDTSLKAKYDAEYVKNYSLWQDIKIFFATIPMLLKVIFKKD